MEIGLDHAGKTEPIFNNLPTHRTIFGRTRDIGRIEAFLNQFTASEHESYPPVLMVVHGQKGVGKTTLVRELAWRCVQKNGAGGFKSVLWFNQEAFVDFVIGDRSILPNSIEPEPQEDIWKFVEEMEQLDPKGTSLLEMVARLREKGITHRSEDAVRDFLMALLRYQPFLLVVDDFDEDAFTQNGPIYTERLCFELERIRAPNKVILTSRTDGFPFSERVPQSAVGLLDERGVFDLVYNDCEKHIPRYLWVNEDLEQTAHWVWLVSGGMAHFITKLIFEEAKREQRKLGLSSQWSRSFSRYTAEYLGAEPVQIINRLTSDERYLLTALLAQDPPRAMKEKELLESAGIVSEDEELANRFHEALVTCYRNKLISHRILSEEKKEDANERLVWYWTLLPFMKEPLREALTDYELRQYYEERTRRWIDFFDYYMEQRQFEKVAEYFDQALSALSWCIEHTEWALAIQIGRRIAESMEELGLAASSASSKRSDYQQACGKIVWAAEAAGDAQTEIEYTLKLIDPSQLHGDSGGRVQQLHRRVEVMGDSGQMIAGMELGHVARLYGRLQARQGVVSEAASLLGEALEEYTHNQNWIEVGWTTVDLAELHLRLGNTSQALELSKQAEQLCKRIANIVAAQEIHIKAITIVAYAAFLDNRLEESSGLFEEAIGLASKAKMDGLVVELIEARRFVDNIRGSFDPVTAIDSLLSQSFLPIQKDTNCTYCRSVAKVIRREDVFSGAAWICSGCGAVYHTLCILEGANRRCLGCQTPYDHETLSRESA